MQTTVPNLGITYQDVFNDLINECREHKLFKSFFPQIQIPIILSFTDQKRRDNVFRLHQYVTDRNDVIWTVIDTDLFKYTWNSVNTYHCFFNKKTGFTIRCGKDIHDEPKYCDLGPEILDLEISVNGCPKVGGHNCKFCYKNNTDKPPTNMSFETFKKIFDSIPKCLYSIAFGITGAQTNPDFPKMLQYCYENDVIPNYTLSGADLNDEILEVTSKYCGAVAVSCYEGNKQLCYDTIKKMYEGSHGKLHVNMHIVLSEDPVQMAHLLNVLCDIQHKKVVGLRNIVFLRIKPVGRAANMNCKISLKTYKKIMEFCLENKIGFGFDSCSAKTAARVLKELGHEELTDCCEPCEGCSYSFYCNTEGIAFPCSFCEHLYADRGIDLKNIDNFSDMWNTNELIKEFRHNAHTCSGSCSVYPLDSED